MRIKIKHPDELQGKTTLLAAILCLFFAGLFCFLYFILDVGDMGRNALLLGALGVFSLLKGFDLLLVRRIERRKTGPDVKALEFTAQGVSVYRPPLPPLFFPYGETSFSLTATAVEIRNGLIYFYTVSAVYMTFASKDTEICIPCAISRKRKQLRPLLDAARRFASFALKVEPFIKQDAQTLRRRADAPLREMEIDPLDDELQQELNIPKMLEEPEATAIRRELEDYMQYGIWPALSGNMRMMVGVAGLILTGIAVRFYFILFGLSALLIPLLPFMGGVILLCAVAKDWIIQRRLKRLRSENSKKGS